MGGPTVVRDYRSRLRALIRLRSIRTRGGVSVDTNRYQEEVAEDLRGESRRPKAAVVTDAEEVYTVKPGGYSRRIAY
jgi:hypothetical protein